MLNITLWNLILSTTYNNYYLLESRAEKTLGRKISGDGNCTLRLRVVLLKENISLQIHNVSMRTENLQNS
jgi:hypothetical protein